MTYAKKTSQLDIINHTDIAQKVLPEGNAEFCERRIITNGSKGLS